MEELIERTLRYGSIIRNTVTGKLAQVEDIDSKRKTFKLVEIEPHGKWNSESEGEYALRILRGAYETKNKFSLNIADIISWYEPYGAIRIIDAHYNLLKLVFPLELVLFKNQNTGEITCRKFVNYANDEYHIYSIMDDKYVNLFHICQFGEMLQRNDLVLLPDDHEFYKMLRGE